MVEALQKSKAMKTAMVDSFTADVLSWLVSKHSFKQKEIHIGNCEPLQYCP